MVFINMLNQHCPQVLINEAEKCKARNPKDYDHIWNGNPLEQSNDYLLSANKIDAAKNLKLNPSAIQKHSVLAVDLAGSGGDLNIAKLIIKRFEGFRTEAYKCPAGEWTIGYGHTNGVKKEWLLTN